MSATFVCLACGKEKSRSPRSSARQCYCGEDGCQRVRKAAWQRRRMKVDADYRANQRRCDEAWRCRNPHYWSEYRQKNPTKAERNRLLQRRRNLRRRRRRPVVEGDDVVIAKMDAVPDNCQKIQANGDFWLVPVIAKMDVVKVRIATIPDDWP